MEIKNKEFKMICHVLLIHMCLMYACWAQDETYRLLQEDKELIGNIRESIYEQDLKASEKYMNRITNQNISIQRLQGFKALNSVIGSTNTSYNKERSFLIFCSMIGVCIPIFNILACSHNDSCLYFKENIISAIITIGVISLGMRRYSYLPSSLEEQRKRSAVIGVKIDQTVAQLSIDQAVAELSLLRRQESLN